MSNQKTNAKELKQQAKNERKLKKQQRKKDRKAEKVANRVDVAYHSQLEPEKAALLLEDIAAGLRNGSVTVQHGDQNLSITPPDVISVRVKARQSANNERLSFRVKWPRGVHPDGPSDIQISS